MRRAIMTSVVGLTAIIVLDSARHLSAKPTPQLRHQFVGGGHWESGGETGQGRRGWQVQLQHFDDDSLQGRLTLTGGRLDHAAIEGQVSGTEVYGALVDDHGLQIGAFAGTVTGTAVSGTYTTADGDSGTWSWEGALPNLSAPPS